MQGPEVTGGPPPVVYGCLRAAVEQVAGETLLRSGDIEGSLFKEGTAEDFRAVIAGITERCGVYGLVRPNNGVTVNALSVESLVRL